MVSRHVFYMLVVSEETEVHSGGYESVLSGLVSIEVPSSCLEGKGSFGLVTI